MADDDRLTLDAERPALVPMQALQPHTYLGHTIEVGDRFDAEPQHVDTIEIQGKGIRVALLPAD